MRHFSCYVELNAAHVMAFVGAGAGHNIEFHSKELNFSDSFRGEPVQPQNDSQVAAVVATAIEALANAENGAGRKTQRGEAAAQYISNILNNFA